MFNSNKIFLILIKGLFFLFPLFFLPFDFLVAIFNVQFLFLVVASLSLILFLFDFYKKEKVVFKRSPFDLPILLLLFFFSLSSFFSIDWMSSFFSFSEDSFSFLSFSSLFIIYFSIVNFLKKEDVYTVLRVFIFGYAISLFILILSLFNIDTRLGFYFINLEKIGFLEGFSIFSAVLFSLVLGFFVFGRKRLPRLRQLTDPRNDKLDISIRDVVYLKIILIAIVLVLALVDFKISWLLLAFSSLVYVVLSRKRASRVVVLGFLAITVATSVLFFYKDIGLDKKILGNDLPKTVFLNHKNSASVVYESLKKKFFLGSGAESFVYNFSLFRNEDLNNTETWQIRHDKPSSFIIDIFGSLGILGLLAFSLIVILFTHLSVSYLKNVLKMSEGIVLLVVLMFVNILSLFLFYSPILIFLFFIFLGLISLLWKENKFFIMKNLLIRKKKTVYFAKLVIFTVILVYFIFFGNAIKYILAHVYFEKAGESNLVRAEILNPYDYKYKIALSKFYLNKARLELMEPSEFQNKILIQENIKRSLSLARTASQKADFSVLAQEYLGMVERDLKNIDPDSNIRAIESFRKAIELEPTNPVLWVELGELYMDSGMIEDAKHAFLHAKKLKEDYPESLLGLAKIYSAENKNREAIEILEKLSTKFGDVEIMYEKGRVYYNSGQTKKAIESFKDVLTINPEHSNALYSLGLSLELLGQDSDAREYFERVLELNPDNEMIKYKLK